MIRRQKYARSRPFLKEGDQHVITYRPDKANYDADAPTACVS